MFLFLPSDACHRRRRLPLLLKEVLLGSKKVVLIVLAQKLSVDHLRCYVFGGCSDSKCPRGSVYEQAAER